MIALITGGRDFCEVRTGADHMGERIALGAALDAYGPTLIRHGGARGADRWAGIWAERRGIPCEVFPADWSKGKSAGPARNQAMVDTMPDVLIKFPGGRGTADCLSRARRKGIPVLEVTA